MHICFSALTSDTPRHWCPVVPQLLVWQPRHRHQDVSCPTLVIFGFQIRLLCVDDTAHCALKTLNTHLSPTPWSSRVPDSICLVLIGLITSFSLWYCRWQLSAIQEKIGQEMERVPSGFCAPKQVNVSSHGVLCSGWQPNPEWTAQSSPWFRVECCTRWPAHNEIYINGLCGHRIHQGCILTLQQPYTMEACPVC